MVALCQFNGVGLRTINTLDLEQDLFTLHAMIIHTYKDLTCVASRNNVGLGTRLAQIAIQTHRCQ